MLFDKNSPLKKAQKNSFSEYLLVFQMVLGLTFSTALRAEPTAQDNIKQAIKSGQLEQAVKLLQQERQIAPKDEQLRFLEGVIQAQQGQTDKAIETFKKLTESNPELSEAYNNLGVLYAAKGKLEESRLQLEKALQTHPSYAAAHRNLSDVQSQLAKQTYAKALQIDSKVKNSTPQLTLLGSLDPQKRAPQVPTITTAAAPSGIDSAKPAPAVSTAVTAQPVSSVPPAPVATKSATPVPAVNTAKADTKKDDAPQKYAKADQTDVRNAISAWAKAWSQKDMNRYLSAYASSFNPPDKMSRAKWENDRHTRIVSKKTINVEINSLKIEVSGNKATARFQQVYESDNFKGNSHKTLEMIKQSDRWLITRETVN
jgi:tetratricopeptide (TPR) repeat protein